MKLQDAQSFNDVLLNPNDLDLTHLEKALATTHGHQIDYADLYFQSMQYETWALENGLVKTAHYGDDQGLSVRVNAGELTGFSYADRIDDKALQQATQSALQIVRAGQQGCLPQTQTSAHLQRYTQDNPLQSIAVNEKITLLQNVDRLARQLDSRIKEVSCSLNASWSQVLIAATDGTMKFDVRPMVTLTISVIAKQGAQTEKGYAGGGGRALYDCLYVDDFWKQLTQQAVDSALVNLDAKAIPAGTMDVVLGPGWPGVLIHEAVGHGLEGDFNRKKTSSFTGMIGQQVASKLCTIVDDGTLANKRGSINIDDEGTPSSRTVLIEKGILKGYMQDKLNARLMKTTSTGNGRRENYSAATMPRMTNTFMLNGDSDPQEIIASVDKGLYAVNFNGGQVDITSGKFVFVISEAYMIEKGKITHPVKGATLIGHGPSALKQVTMVGNDLELDQGIGTCGKDGQSIPAGVGQPTLRINQITVGGTQ